jgi:predicted enzyme related to lactoylglutathione lyase
VLAESSNIGVSGSTQAVSQQSAIAAPNDDPRPWTASDAGERGGADETTMAIGRGMSAVTRVKGTALGRGARRSAVTPAALADMLPARIVARCVGGRMKFVHQELHTTDPAKAKAFYRALFGWTYEDMAMPEGAYTMINTAQGPLGGMMETQNGMPPTWIGYVDVESIERTVTRAVEAGGKVLVPKQQVGEHGYMAWLQDPQGATFAVWQSTAPTQAQAPAGEKASKKAPKKASKTSAAKASAAAKGPSKKAAAKAPAADKPAAKKGAAKKGAAKKGAAKKGAAKKPAAKKAAKASAPSKKTGKKTGKTSGKTTGKKKKKTAKK